MKLLLTILLTLVTGGAFAQEHATPKDKWSKDLYISDEFCATRGLKPGQTNDVLRVWNGGMNAGEKISRLVDIRYYFATQEEAVSYLESNIGRLSEGGDPVESKIQVPGAANLKIFDEGAAGRKMNKALGLESHSYFFLFTVKNYVCKVFFMADKDITLGYATDFAVEAAKRLNAVLR